ncbi:putative reverse transcriptase domain-containing protein [Tanacetum coccineum]
MEKKGDGSLYFMDRIWVPMIGGVRTKIMDEAHKSRYSIHPGADKMYYDLRDSYWWPGMKKDCRMPTNVKTYDGIGDPDWLSTEETPATRIPPNAPRRPTNFVTEEVPETNEVGNPDFSWEEFAAKYRDNLAPFITPSTGANGRRSLLSWRPTFFPQRKNQETRGTGSQVASVEPQLRKESKGECRRAKTRQIHPLTMTPKEVFAAEGANWPRPPPINTPVDKRVGNGFCDYHGEKGHSTDECIQLKKQIEKMVRAGRLALQSFVINPSHKSNISTSSKHDGSWRIRKLTGKWNPYAGIRSPEVDFTFETNGLLLFLNGLIDVSSLYGYNSHTPQNAARRLQKWSVLLGEHNITYRPRTASKGHILADFIVELPDDSQASTLKEEVLSQPWTLITDGSSRFDGSGAGLILTDPEGIQQNILIFRDCLTSPLKPVKGDVARASKFGPSKLASIVSGPSVMLSAVKMGK